MFGAIILLAAVTSAPSNVKAADLLRQATRIPKGLFYLAEQPSGAMFCNDVLSKRQERLFDARFGVRYNRLVAVVSEREGLALQLQSGYELSPSCCGLMSAPPA
jgi:hypothetical protein